MCVQVGCSVDDLFKLLFLIESGFQVSSHKARGDNNYAEGHWVSSPDELPDSRFAWEPPNTMQTGGHSLVAKFPYRKVKFESAPSALTSKPFQNEEEHYISQYAPGSRYVANVAVFTTAPFGEKFTVLFKYTMQVASSTTSYLLVTFGVHYLQSVNMMMKPMIASGIDGGVRSSFKQFRTTLEGFYSVQDVPGGKLPALEVSAEQLATVAEEAAAEHPPSPRPTVHVPEQPTGPLAPPDFLSLLSDHLVYNAQVLKMAEVIGASMHSLKYTQQAPRALALGVTLLTLHIAVQLLGYSSATAPRVAAGCGRCCAGRCSCWTCPTPRWRW